MEQSFYDNLKGFSWDEVGEAIAKKTSTDVERALSTSGERSHDDFMALYFNHILTKQPCV